MYLDDIKNSTEVELQRSFSGGRNPVSARVGDGRSSETSAGRLLSGAIGFGSTLSATLTQHRPLGATEARVLLAGGLGLLLLALLLVLFPKVLAYPIGFVALWFGAGFLASAFKLRKTGRAHGKQSP
jgi:cardiolipin synthase